MGKMYKGELARLPQTYKAAVELDSVSLISAVAAAATGPLVVIGSGGSLSVATYLCQLHERYTHNLAKAVTPLEFLEGGPRRDAAIWCISASGRNADIQAALECAVLREPKQVLAICMTTKSPLAALAQKYRFADVVEIELSSENDGFLATNSLLAMAIVGANAYRRFAAPNEPLPPTYSDFLAMTLGQEGVERLSQRATSVLFGRETISLLYGNALKAAAVDLESRFVEAALGNLHAADFRNFAHGRHHWLAKRGASTGVLAFVGATVRELADRTFALLPPETPMLRWDFQGDDALQALAGLVVGLHVADDAGDARGIDPGRPGVPPFGRRIYHLQAVRKLAGSAESIEFAAIRRKSRQPLESLAAQGNLEKWQRAYREASQRLNNTVFGGVVFDYDGTLCDPGRRFESVEAEIGSELTQLAKRDVQLAVVSGRGRSVRKVLQGALARRHWGQVLVGYYNGAEIGGLADDHLPGAGAAEGILREVAAALRSKLAASQNLLEERRCQLSVVAGRSAEISGLWERVKEIVEGGGWTGLTVVRSSHSVDVFEPSVSKTNVLRRFHEFLNASDNRPLLCIGDRGRWPGNDFCLLEHPHSLSVDEVSLNPDTCWNLAPPGHRGVQATLYYMRRMQPAARGGIRLALD